MSVLLCDFTACLTTTAGETSTSHESPFNAHPMYFSFSFQDRLLTSYRVAQKSKPPPIFQKIVLKIANEIRFLRKVEV